MKHLTYIYAIGAAQGFVLVVALWFKTDNQRSIRILPITMLLMIFDLTNPVTRLFPAIR